MAVSILAAVYRRFPGVRYAQDGTRQEVIHSVAIGHAVLSPCAGFHSDKFIRFYKGLRWFKKGAEPVVLIPGHNQHHRYINPVIFDAFSGSLYSPQPHPRPPLPFSQSLQLRYHPPHPHPPLHHVTHLLLGQHPHLGCLWIHVQLLVSSHPQ